MLDIFTLVQNNLLWSGAVLFGTAGLILFLVFRGHSVELGPVKIGARLTSDTDRTPSSATKKRTLFHAKNSKQNDRVVLLPALDGDLGHGIKIGGVLEGFELHAVACDWVKHVNGNDIRSGWLYSNNNAGAYLAVAFFKVQISPDGTGNIHIRDVASPPHTIWLTTYANHHKHNFHYMFIGGIVDAIEAANWSFRWKD